MPIAQNPWVDRDHNGPAKPAKSDDTNEDAAEAKDAPEAPVNPLLSISRGRRLPKG